MIRLSDAHIAFKNHVIALERTAGKKFFPQAGQIMYAPSLEQELIKNPQGATNKIGFFIQGDSGYEFAVYTMELQCLLTYPETTNDADYITALAHADDFVAAINEASVSGLGSLTRKDGPHPVPGAGRLSVRVDFTITTISL